MIGRLRPRPRGERRDGGLASIELAIILPVFIALAVLATVLGRRMIAQTAIDLAAHDAARAASEARAESDARTQGDLAGKAALTASGTTCTTFSVTWDFSQWEKVPLGQPAWVTATITCEIDLRYLAVPGFPGKIDLTSTFSSPLDQYRTRS